MIEAHEDISLVVDRQNQDVREAREQYQAIAEGREIHPALRQQQAAVTNATTIEVIPRPENQVPSETPTASAWMVPVAFKLALAAGFIVFCLVARHLLARRESK